MEEDHSSQYQQDDQPQHHAEVEAVQELQTPPFVFEVTVANYDQYQTHQPLQPQYLHQQPLPPPPAQTRPPPSPYQYKQNRPPPSPYQHKQNQPQPPHPSPPHVPLSPRHQNYPPPAQSPQFPRPTWSTGLFDCMEDPNNALMTALVPCLTFGQIAEVVDSGNTTCATSGLLYGLVAAISAMPCLVSSRYRTKIRSMYGLIETPESDYLTHFFCELCSLCQEYRELRIRGLEPSLGWHGNVARSSNMQVPPYMTPPMNHRMN